MAECIERDLATKAIYELCCREELGSEGESALDKALAAVEEIPAVDVRPIVHGKWIEVPGTRIDALADYKCSRCGGIMSMSNDLALEWCGRCGAKMDGKDGNK